MTQDELDALPDVTQKFGQEERIIDGRKVIVPVLENAPFALFQKNDDGVFVCMHTGDRYVVGWLNGVRVKRLYTGFV